jgi:8-oxo-dGTP pyrophosphatase MutT (NUDIX family)
LLGNGLWNVVFYLIQLARAFVSPTTFGAAGAVFDASGRVLLVRHSYQPGWQFPGGGVNRGEPPADAVLRELGEELGLEGGEATFIGLYARRGGWVACFVSFYRITGAAVHFRPNLEIREICYVHPHAPPPGCSAATLRRLAELRGEPVSPYW